MFSDLSFVWPEYLKQKLFSSSSIHQISINQLEKLAQLCRALLVVSQSNMHTL